MILLLDEKASINNRYHCFTRLLSYSLGRLGQFVVSSPCRVFLKFA
jgi:hypothetical protein